MTNKTVPLITSEPVSTKDLANVFEQSVAIMCEDKDTIARNPKKSRLRRASLPLHIDPVDLQKRAMDNAAKALTALWKISKPGRPKAPRPVMVPHRQIS